MQTQAFTGLTEKEVQAARAQHEHSHQQPADQPHILQRLSEALKDPMLVLLLAAAVLYFILGQTDEAYFMVGAIIAIYFISVYQEARSQKALEALKKLTAPCARVIREGLLQEIKTEELVVGDLMMVQEGDAIPADGILLQGNDLMVNESTLSGEAFPIDKHTQDAVYQGTVVVRGMGICQVNAIGSESAIGRIGQSMSQLQEEKTPLEQQIGDFVKRMASIGFIVFLLVWGWNFYLSMEWTGSLLKALALAMSIIPEEIPVAFTTFMALGAWRMMREGIIVKKTKIVETLGAATVICTDKTGTITENKMQLAGAYLYERGTSSKDNPLWIQDPEFIELVSLGMWASEPSPFDPMELALHECYGQASDKDLRQQGQLIAEYPLEGTPPMMTHVFDVAGRVVVAAKGAPERIAREAQLSMQDRTVIEQAVEDFASQGLRVLAVATAMAPTPLPAKQEQFSWRFVGLVAFQDPIKKGIPQVFEAFYQAGIKLKIITGDHTTTAQAIAQQAGFRGNREAIEGRDIIEMDETMLQSCVQQTDLYTRMFPEAKLRVVKALQKNGDIVAMTGDGVNDGPALKAAHIGIAMGRKGTETAKQAASLVLVDDDLGKMVSAVAAGRRIYANLKKAIQYIISIHIPIILTVLLPLLLGWKYPNIFTPVHIIFLELIMGPTCSIVYENDPAEAEDMRQPPRPFTHNFLSWGELSVSILQGIGITVGTLLTYQFGLEKGMDENSIRTLVFLCLISANIFLTLVNRSFYHSILTTIRYKNWMVPSIILICVLMLLLILWAAPLRRFFDFDLLPASYMCIAAGIGLLSTLWFEIYKYWRRTRN